MIETQLIEGVLSSLFDLLNKKVVSKPEDQSKFDFLVRDKNDKIIAIEVKRQKVDYKSLNYLQNALMNTVGISEFYLITPEKPNSRDIKRFNEVFKPSKLKTYWNSINEYLSKQDLNFELDDDLKTSLLNLQIAALTSKYDLYHDDYVGSDLGYDKLAENLKKNIKNVKEGKIDKSDVRFGLRRQFPDKLISTLDNDHDKISKILKFGSKYNEAIIILTDIKNFSSIVSNADPDELNELMSKYYSKARELVFKYGGILDKFIGDAVLAIFNYPHKSPEASKNALKFSAELILIGKTLLDDFQKKLDHEIPTGTRVGIASGSIYPLNIGQEEIEITFIGDKINFAARLEKNSPVNGILMSNRFYYKLCDNHLKFIQSIKLEKLTLDPKDAKGQPEKSKTWCILEDQITKILV